MASRDHPAECLSGTLATVKDTLDFIIIGAQKAGTSSLYEHLRQHPEIWLPPAKEAPYFSHDPVFARGWNHYMKMVGFSNPQRQWGTVTPQYMVGGMYKRGRSKALADAEYDERTVPLRIYERLPKVRLVAILRDPVDRARSHHQMMAMDGFEQRSFDDAIAELLQPESLEHSRRHPEEISGYVTWGEYRRILSGYYSVFPSEQLLVVFTAELEHSPEQLLGRIYDFLGVSPDFIPGNLDVRYRPSGGKRRFSWMSPHRSWSPQGVKRALKHKRTARAAWHLLPAGRRLRVKQGFDHFGYKVELWNRRGAQKAAEPSHNTVELLRAHYAEEADALTSLVQASLPW